MKRVVGEVDYSVEVDCPNCNRELDLTQYPYEDDDNAEKLGSCVFGSTTVPAKWKGVDIVFTCHHCKKPFLLESLEY